MSLVEESSLPDGWISEVENTTGRILYTHTLTRVTQYEFPPKLPANWVPARNPIGEGLFFVNTETGDYRLTLPIDDDEVIVVEGEVANDQLSQNHSTQSTSSSSSRSSSRQPERPSLRSTLPENEPKSSHDTSSSDQPAIYFPSEVHHPLEVDPLPDGWVELYDHKKNRPYFANRRLGISQWDFPSPLPPGWIAAVDQTSKKVYYVDENTGHTQWVRPGSEEERIAKETEARLILSRPLRALQTPLDLGRLMGRWYILAFIPSRYEAGISNCVENYHWDDHRKVVQVVFNYNAAKTRSPTVMRQRGRIVNAPINTHWSVSPQFMGIYFDLNLPFLVLHVNVEYTVAVVGVPDRKFLWMMTRLKPIKKRPSYTIEYLQSLDQLRAAGSIPPLSDVSTAGAAVQVESTVSSNSTLDPVTEEIMLRDALNRAADWGYDTRKLLNVEWTV